MQQLFIECIGAVLCAGNRVLKKIDPSLPLGSQETNEQKRHKKQPK